MPWTLQCMKEVLPCWCLPVKFCFSWWFVQLRLSWFPWVLLKTFLICFPKRASCVPVSKSKSTFRRSFLCILQHRHRMNFSVSFDLRPGGVTIRLWDFDRSFRPISIWWSVLSLLLSAFTTRSSAHAPMIAAILSTCAISLDWNAGLRFSSGYSADYGWLGLESGGDCGRLCFLKLRGGWLVWGLNRVYWFPWGVGLLLLFGPNCGFSY